MNHSAEFSLLLDMSRQQAWERLSDLSIAHHYVPGLIGSEITTAQVQGIGASRRVFMSETRFLDETVTEWEEGHGFVIRLHCAEAGPPAPFCQASFRYWLEEMAENQVQLGMRLDYDLRWGLTGRVLNAILLARPVWQNLRDGAIGLKDYYHTGVAVTAERRRELLQQYRARED